MNGTDTAAGRTVPLDDPDRIATRRGSINLNGIVYGTTVIEYGGDQPRRSIELRDTDIADSFDLEEIAPANATGRWRSMAMLALSLVTVDGIPADVMREPPTRDDVRRRLRAMGEDGVLAAAQALAPPDAAAPGPAVDPEAAHRAQVGNSPATPPSAS